MSAGAATRYGEWHQHATVVVDVETTGIGDDDRVVEIGAARFERGRLLDAFGALVHPQRPIPHEASQIHGITDADVAQAPSFVTVLRHLIRLGRGAHPVAYNAPFDQRFLLTEMSRLRGIELHRIPLFDPQERWIDPLVWARVVDRQKKNKLSDVCERYSIDTGTSHRALDDVMATGRVLYAMQHKIGDMTISEMLRRQKFYFESQERDRRAWRNNAGWR